MAAGGASERREKQGGVEDHCRPNTPGVQSATSQALVFTRTSFTQVAGVGGVTAYFPHLKQSCQHAPIPSNRSLQQSIFSGFRLYLLTLNLKLGSKMLDVSMEKAAVPFLSVV